jgi:hypothetical protein
MTRITLLIFVMKMCIIILAIIWKMIEDFQPPAWATEEPDDDS